MGWTASRNDRHRVERPGELALIHGLMVQWTCPSCAVTFGASSKVQVRHTSPRGLSGYHGHGIVWIKVIIPQVCAADPSCTVSSGWCLEPISLVWWSTMAADPRAFELRRRWGRAAARAGSPSPDIVVDACRLRPGRRWCRTLLSWWRPLRLLWWAGRGRTAGSGAGEVRRGGRGLSAEPGLWLATVVSALIFAAGAAGH